MTNLPFSDELLHYGVRGMKWGVVRKRNPDGGRVTGQPIDKKRSKTVATPPKSAGRRAELNPISDKELQTRINRLNMEKQYSSLLQERRLQTDWKARTLNNAKKFAGLQYQQVEVRAVSDIRNAGYQAGKKYVASAFTGQRR